MAGEAIVLASASPRRRALLAEAGLTFAVRPADVDETVVGSPEPEAAAVELACRKALAVVAADGGAPDGPAPDGPAPDGPAPDGHAPNGGATARWYVGSDTIVAVPRADGWRLLGKPADGDEAAAMLRSLSGTTHRVVTGVCVARSDGAHEAAAETTRVTMRPLADDEIAAYVASGEWRDKAGGYAIQESADRFVTALEGGGFDNVVGLPVALTLELLAGLGAPVPGAEAGR